MANNRYDRFGQGQEGRGSRNSGMSDSNFGEQRDRGSFGRDEEFREESLPRRRGMTYGAEVRNGSLWNDDPRMDLNRYSDSWQSESKTERRESFAGRGPKGWKRADERIREDVCEMLERDHRIDASDIDVSVKEGIVTLSGRVDSRRVKRAAEDVIEHLSGVKDVRNELSVDQSFFEQAKEMLTGSSSSSTTFKTPDAMKEKRH